MTAAALVTLLTGIIIGYTGQRSRMCFVGGIRDFILVRDTFLLKGMFAFAAVAGIGFIIVRGLTVNAGFGGFDNATLYTTIAGGFGVGYLSVLANGCPLRQHVLAMQGNISACAYLGGFFTGAWIFHTLTAPLLMSLLP